MRSRTCRITTLLLLVFACSKHLQAQNEEQDPIDAQLDHCLQDTTGETTAGMKQCFYIAYRSWDIELNKAFNELIPLLSAEGQTALRRSEEAWLAYRDAQQDLNGAIYYEELQGTLHHVTAAASNMDLVKQRVLELRQELTDVKEGK